MKSIRQCLNKRLIELCESAMQLEELSLKVARLLPTELANQCQVGSFNKGCLVLITHDASWASQLRYAIPELRDKLRKNERLYQLSSIKIVVTPPTINDYKRAKSTSAPKLTIKAQKTLLQESEQCSYQPLKRALLNLAQITTSTDE